MGEHRFQKHPQSKFKLFTKKTLLNKDFVLFHIKFDPLNWPDLKKHLPFSWKSMFLDPFNMHFFVCTTAKKKLKKQKDK